MKLGHGTGFTALTLATECGPATPPDVVAATGSQTHGQRGWRDSNPRPTV
ncbi:hypothetical protein RS9916_38327 [Synechococcus sp. RS9916]|nr:hypothetical protein RS9916_38327 [Synechococcus sp. RS9916]